MCRPWRKWLVIVCALLWWAQAPEISNAHHHHYQHPTRRRRRTILYPSPANTSHMPAEAASLTVNWGNDEFRMKHATQTRQTGIFNSSELKLCARWIECVEFVCLSIPNRIILLLLFRYFFFLSFFRYVSKRHSDPSEYGSDVVCVLYMWVRCCCCFVIKCAIG